MYTMNVHYVVLLLTYMSLLWNVLEMRRMMLPKTRDVNGNRVNHKTTHGC